MKKTLIIIILAIVVSTLIPLQASATELIDSSAIIKKKIIEKKENKTITSKKIFSEELVKPQYLELKKTYQKSDNKQLNVQYNPNIQIQQQNSQKSVSKVVEYVIENEQYIQSGDIYTKEKDKHINLYVHANIQAPAQFSVSNSSGMTVDTSVMNHRDPDFSGYEIVDDSMTVADILDMIDAKSFDDAESFSLYFKTLIFTLKNVNDYIAVEKLKAFIVLEFSTSTFVRPDSMKAFIGDMIDEMPQASISREDMAIFSTRVEGYLAGDASIEDFIVYERFIEHFDDDAWFKGLMTSIIAKALDVTSGS